MLYLAEFNKPIGFGRPSLVLLAKQQPQDNWQPVNEEPIQLDNRVDVSRLRDGCLVLAEIGGNRSVQRINEAAKQLVTYLQNFSRLQDKARSQEEEIETWKQSLTFQSQELNRREMEIESQEEELQRLYEKYQGVEEEKRSLEAKREEITSLESHIAEQQRLVGEQREALAHQQEELQQRLQEAQGSRLGEVEAAQLHTLLGQLQQDLQSGIDPQPYLTPVQEELQQRQQALEQSLAHVGQDRQQVEQQQAELDQALQAWQRRRGEWFQARSTLENLRAEVRSQEISCQIRQDQLQRLSAQLQLQDQIHQKAFGLVGEYDFITATGMESKGQSHEPEMSIEELQESVNHLRREYEQRSGQVNQQLAELDQNRQTLDELKEKLASASPDDQFDIEMDIDYYQSACSALEETILPQQENLQREYEELVRQEARLKARLGDDTEEVSLLPTVDIGPLLSQLDDQKQLQQDEKQRLEAQVQQMLDSLRPQQETLNQQQKDIDQRWEQLEQEEQDLRARIRDLAAQTRALDIRQELLTQEQSYLESLGGHLDQLTTLCEGSTASESSQSCLESIRSLLTTLTGATAGAEIAS